MGIVDTCRRSAATQIEREAPYDNCAKARDRTCDVGYRYLRRATRRHSMGKADIEDILKL